MAPLPSTSTFFIHSNFGILGSLHHLCESVEEEFGVVGSRRRLRMPLHRENWFGFVFDAFDGFIVGVYEPRLKRRLAEAFCVDGVAVVLGGDVTAVSRQVECGLILRTVTKLQLVSVAAHSQGQYLSA